MVNEESDPCIIVPQAEILLKHLRLNTEGHQGIAVFTLGTKVHPQITWNSLRS